MSLFTAAHATSAAKAHLDVLAGLANTTFDGVEKLVQLNMQAAKSALEESADAAQAALSAKTLPELLAAQAAFLKPGADKAAAYGRAVYEVTSSLAADLADVAQGQVVQAQKGFAGAVDQALKNAPAGSDSTVNLVKSAIAATNNAFESVNKAAKQAADLAEANIAAVADAVGGSTKAGRASSRNGKKAA